MGHLYEKGKKYLVPSSIKRKKMPEQELQEIDEIEAMFDRVQFLTTSEGIQYIQSECVICQKIFTGADGAVAVAERAHAQHHYKMLVYKHGK